jgi:hypothetical protein
VTYQVARPLYLDIAFTSGIGAEVFVASGCDRDDGIDELVELSAPVVDKSSEQTVLSFTAQTTLWDKVEYTFTCTEDKLLYGYTVYGMRQW